MKATILTFLGCVAILMSGYSLGWSSGCDQGNCGSNFCNPYETECQCTDPACNRPWDSDCISRAECCEAFGNMGAR